MQEGQKPTWLWGRSRAQGKEAPSDFKWMTWQKPPCVPISMQWHAHLKSNWWVPTAASQGKVRGRYKFKSWLYLGPSPGTSLFRACKPPSIKRSSDNPQSSLKDPWGRWRRQPEAYWFANYKVLLKYKSLASHWNLTPNTVSFGFLESLW